MQVSSKIEFILYSLLDTLDVMSRTVAHALGLSDGLPDRNPIRKNQSAYLERRELVERGMEA